MDLMLTYLRILAVSGQTLDDMFKYVESADRLALAKSTLLWRHMAPTAPDTLCECGTARDAQMTALWW